MRHFGQQSHIFKQIFINTNFLSSISNSDKMPPRTKRTRNNLELTENIASLARMMSIFFTPLF